MSLNFNAPIMHLNGANAAPPPLELFNSGFHINGSDLTKISYSDIVLSGVGSLTLANAKANSLNYLKLYGGCEQRNLPEGYTEYDYLRSSGTQYIDLGYKGKANTKVEIKFRYYQTSSATGSGRVFGSRTNSSTNAFAIGSSSGVVASTGNKVFWCYDGQSFYVSDNTFGLDEWQTVVFSATEHTINGTTEGDDYNITTFETPSNLMLFAFDNNGTVGCGYIDIAYCKLWDDDGTLVRDVVPAGSGTTYSMYDKVSNTLLPNAGSGDFSVGNEVVPTPSTPVDVVCNNGIVKCSKNMCDVKAENIDVGHYISAQGVVSVSEYNFTYIQYILVQPNTTYTLSFSSPVYFASISEYSTAEDSGFVKRNTYYSVNTGNPPFDLVQCTVTTGSTTNYIRWGSNMYKSTAITIEDVLAVNYMFEIGSTPTTYTPYVAGGIYTDGTTETVQDSLNNTATAENLFAVGTYKDVQEILTGAVTRNIGIKVLDGTESWTKASGYTNIFYAPISGAYYNASSAERIAVPCTHFVGTDATNTNMADNTIKLTAQGSALTNPLIYIKASVSNDDLTTWQTWLAAQYAAGTPVIIIFPKKTATSETVTGQSLTTKKGSNTIQITQSAISGLSLEASYKGTQS